VCAHAALRPREAEAFGRMRPIPADRLVSVKDHDRLDLGTHSLRFLDSPGHAPHELTLLDEHNRCLYTGDAAGLYFPGDEILMPIAPAPSFDLEKNLETFRRLLSLEPKALLFSHYGPHPDPPKAIGAMMSAYPAWARLVKEKLAVAGEDGLLRELYCLTCREAQPAMAIVHNVVHMYARLLADGHEPMAVLRELHSELDSARERIGKTFLKVAPERATVVTLSYSESVRACLLAAHGRRRIVQVLIMEAGPVFEGRTMAKVLEADGVPATVIPDDAGVVRVADATYVLTGADSVLRDGSVVNKRGTRALAAAAAKHG